MLGGMRSLPAANGPEPPAARLARWLIPLVSVVLISSCISFAATVAVGRAWGNTAEAQQASQLTQRWVEIRVIQTDATPRSMRCLTRPGVVTESVVMVAPSDFGAATSQLCADT
jgi:hypothetical protein